MVLSVGFQNGGGFGLAKHLTRNWLKEKQALDWTLAQMAREAEVAITTIWCRLQEAGLPTARRRDANYRNATWLREAYWGRGLSCREMAQELNCSEATIRYWMTRHSIDRRTLSESNHLRWQDEVFREKQGDALRRAWTPEARAKQSTKMKQVIGECPEIRAKQSRATEEGWEVGRYDHLRLSEEELERREAEEKRIRFAREAKRETRRRRQKTAAEGEKRRRDEERACRQKTAKERKKRYYREHRQEIISKGKLYYARHRKERLVYSREWRRRNPEKRRASKQKRRAMLLGVGGSYTAGEWDALLSRYPNCPGCGRAFTKDNPSTIDHVIPLSRGGNNLIQNIQPLCGGCNGKKGQSFSDFRDENRIAENGRNLGRGN